VRRLVGAEAYPRAISWQGLAFNFPGLIAPLLGGWLTARYSAGWAFFLNGGLTSMFIVTVLLMPAGEHERREGASVAGKGMGALIAHIRSSPGLAFSSTAQVVIGLTICAAVALVPSLVLARHPGNASYAIADVLCAQGIAATLGFLMTPVLSRAASGVLIGSIAMGGLALVGLGYDHGFAGLILLAPVVTLAMTLGFSTANILAQAAGDSSFRARIAFVNLFVFCCIAPLSALVMGRLAVEVPLGRVISGSGWLCLALTAALVLKTSSVASGIRLRPATQARPIEETNH
jgi:MFS family permease